MSDQNPKRSLADALRHPLANVVIGFLLTGVVGGALTNYYTQQRTQAARTQAQMDARKESIARLASLNAEHVARAEQLLRAIELGSGKDDVAELMELYEAARMRWRTETSPALLAAREVLPAEAYYRLRTRLKTELGKRFLDPLQTCAQEAQRALAQEDSVAEVLATCDAQALIEGAGNCTDALMDLFYETASGTIERKGDDWAERVEGLHRERIAAACAAPPPTAPASRAAPAE